MGQLLAVLASKKDKVLRFAYPVGDLLQAFVFFWKGEIGLALGYHGPKPIGKHSVPGQVHHVQIPDGRESDHGDYIPGNSPNGEQLSAARFADEVLQGAITPIGKTHQDVGFGVPRVASYPCFPFALADKPPVAHKQVE